MKLILFDNLLKIELGICKQMIKLGLEFVVFSNDSNPNKKFELTNCPLTNENGLLSNRNGHYVEYFERIEVLNKIPKKSKDFDGFNFLVESQAFYGRFSLYDKQQTEIRYKRLEEFLKEFENLPGILLDYNEEIMKANKSLTEIGDFIGLFEDFNKVKKMKKINCTFEYFFEKYVLNI